MIGPANVTTALRHGKKIDAGAGNDATVELAAVADHYYELCSMSCSLAGSGTPASNCSLLFYHGTGATVAYQQYVLEKKDYHLSWRHGFFIGDPGDAVTLQLQNPGTDVEPKISFTYRLWHGLKPLRDYPQNSHDARGGGAAITKTLAAISDGYHVIDALHYSYSANPTSGAITVAFGGVTKWQANIQTLGHKAIEFPRGLYTGTDNEQCVVTLADGSQPKCLNVFYR